MSREGKNPSNTCRTVVFLIIESMTQKQINTAKTNAPINSSKARRSLREPSGR